MTRSTKTPLPIPSGPIVTELTQFEKSELAIRKAESLADAAIEKAELAVAVLSLENPVDDQVKSAAEWYLIGFFKDRE